MPRTNTVQRPSRARPSSSSVAVKAMPGVPLRGKAIQAPSDSEPKARFWVKAYHVEPRPMPAATTKESNSPISRRMDARDQMTDVRDQMVFVTDQRSTGCGHLIPDI